MEWYLISDDIDGHLYVGRSRTLTQRIGVDHRAKTKEQANLTHKIALKLGIPVETAREYMFENFFVRFIRVEDDNTRAVFEVYAAMELNTPFNSFRES